MPITLLKYVLFGAVTGTAIFGGLEPSTTQHAAIPYHDTTLSVHQELDMLDVWIEELITLESRGNERTIILDVNGRYSYGCLQFQKRTFEEFGKKYLIFTDGDVANIEELILDCKLQKRLTRLIIENEKDGWEHWYTSVIKRNLGYPPLDNEKSEGDFLPLIARVNKK